MGSRRNDCMWQGDLKFEQITDTQLYVWVRVACGVKNQYWRSEQFVSKSLQVCKQHNTAGAVNATPLASTFKNAKAPQLFLFFIFSNQTILK